MKRILTLLLGCCLLFTACSDDDKEPPVAPVQTLFMYLPWSGDSQALTDYFITNIEDMKLVVKAGLPTGCRVLVFFMPDNKSGKLFELKAKGNSVEQKTYKEYTSPAITTKEGLASILADVQSFAPAPRYAMTIGCHGMAWMPAATTKSPAEERFTTTPEKEYWEHDGPLTRWFGGTSAAYRTDITTLAAAIESRGIVMDFILFDDCYMSSVEVAYDLRHAARHLIGSTSEIMAAGFPYAKMGRYMLGDVNYTGICDAFHSFYTSYTYPYGTIGVTVCEELDALADVMKRINAVSTPVSNAVRDEIQVLDGYTYTRFFDMGDYVRRYCTDEGLLAEFERALEAAVPSAYHRHTEEFYSMGNGTTLIETFSGITISDPSVDSEVVATREDTAWWKATH